MEMIDWLASKIGVLIAIGVLTAFVLGVFAWQNSTVTDREGQKLADSISGILDDMGNVDAATVLNVSFGTEPGQLPHSIGGKEYSVNITSDSVIITSGNRAWMSKPVTRVIPQNISIRHYNLTEYDNLEFEKFTGEYPSDGYFFIERARIDVSGEMRYLTLVYWDEYLGL